MPQVLHRRMNCAPHVGVDPTIITEFLLTGKQKPNTMLLLTNFKTKESTHFFSTTLSKTFERHVNWLSG